MNKDTKDKRFELRLTANEFHKLKIRADLYAEGNISRLVRHWINNAPVEYLLRKKSCKKQSSETKN